MHVTVGIVFAVVYAGMLLGELPGLALDRTGIALLGAIALLVAGAISPETAWRSVDVPTIALLFGLMVVSAQLRLSGFYAAVTRRIAVAPLAPGALLAALITVAGVLSAVLANDVVCLAMAPVVVASCTGRGLDPVPFLLGLAAAANVGSAATLIGNPQNMLIGQVLRLSFAGYLAVAAVPAAAGLAIAWLVIRWRFRGRWAQRRAPVAVGICALDTWQTAKGLAVVAALVAAFLATSWPREVLAIGAAGVLLTSRRVASREMLGLVDWQLLVLFIALFIVNHALLDTGMLGSLQGTLAALGVDLRDLRALFVVTAVLSNLVSNVPAVMLLLPIAHGAQAGAVLALASTLAGNLLVIGSIANVIVIDQAARLGVAIGWRDHARVGLPITALTIALAAAWLWVWS
jgi:Na+/H+ antiporter NhaD/arsenite permease-like protein